jgi:hypothetical protein
LAFCFKNNPKNTRAFNETLNQPTNQPTTKPTQLTRITQPSESAYLYRPAKVRLVTVRLYADFRGADEIALRDAVSWNLCLRGSEVHGGAAHVEFQSLTHSLKGAWFQHP